MTISCFLTYWGEAQDADAVASFFSFDTPCRAVGRALGCAEPTPHVAALPSEGVECHHYAAVVRVALGEHLGFDVYDSARVAAPDHCVVQGVAPVVIR